jgi:hypothetical protein
MQTAETIKTKVARGELLGLEEFVYWQCARAGVIPVGAWEATRRAFSRSRAKHPDLNRFAEEMNFIACAVVPVGQPMTLDRYIELLYCAAKFSGFGRGLRSLRTKTRVTVQ